jgi:UDP-glucose 4-epimerase
MTLQPQARVLVTGGAGYIGSHMVLHLRALGCDVAVIDNLTVGSRRLVPDGVPLHVCDVGDAAPILADFKPEAVIHFAGSASVPESVADPLKYYTNNFVASRRLIEACVAANIMKFIFSSTSAVYGSPATVPITEDAVAQPINPYGNSKLMTETALHDVGRATPLRSVVLRYFNVAGADAEGRAGPLGAGSTNLIKSLAEFVTGKRPALTVYGTDYPTPDGTCVRDYIHVLDLVDAHIAALAYLLNGGDSRTWNCGYGIGTSVLEVMAAAERVIGGSIAYDLGPRRPGDPPVLVAANDAIRRDLPWTPTRMDVGAMVASAIAWERRWTGD